MRDQLCEQRGPITKGFAPYSEDGCPASPERGRGCDRRTINNWATGLRPESTDRHGADGFGYVIRYVWAPGPITMASPRTRKRSARLRRKEGWVVTAVLQQLGNPVARPLVPKAAAQPFGARSREHSFCVHQTQNGWRCWLKGRCPSAAPKDWRNAWNPADPRRGSLEARPWGFVTGPGLAA